MSGEDGVYLIAYDISDPRRLGRVHRYLQGCALWVQYSVFVGRFSPPGLEAAASELRSRMDPRADDIRIYHLPAFAHPILIGDSLWPEDVLFTGLRPNPLPAFTLPLMGIRSAFNSPPPTPVTPLESAAPASAPSKTTP